MEEIKGTNTPEVGDVWLKEWSNETFVILDFNPISNDFIAYNKKAKTLRLIDAETPMSSQLKYLGKSKANIEDLFEVKNHVFDSLHCNGCGKDVFENKEDYFMLKDEIWQEVCKSDYVSIYNVLCKDCTEKVLGRKLVKEDYQPNNPCNEFLFEVE